MTSKTCLSACSSLQQFLSSLRQKTNTPFKLLHSFHSILYHSVGFKMAVLLIFQEDIIYDDESVFEEEAKIKKRNNLKLLIAVTIYCEESKCCCKRMKKEHSGDKDRNRRDNVNTEATFCMPPRNAREMSWWIGAIFLAESRFLVMAHSKFWSATIFLWPQIWLVWLENMITWGCRPTLTISLTCCTLPCLR